MSAVLLDFSRVKDAAGLRQQLKKISTKAPYGWIKAIVDVTTDEYVERIVRKHKLKPHRYAVWNIEDNLEQASRILNNSIERRNEILALEAEAIKSALDLQLAEQIQPQDLKVSRVGLKAARNQAHANSSDADQPSLTYRDHLISDGRKARLAIHNAHGTALNYGERVTFLRSLLARNIVIAYERLYAIWIGIASAYGEKVGQPPRWDADRNPLGDLIRWLREVTIKLDEGMVGESVYDVHFLVGAQNLVKDAATVTAALQTAGDCSLAFDLTRAHFPHVSDAATVRLLGVGAALTYQDCHSHFQDGMKGPKSRTIFNYVYDYVMRVRQSISVDMQIGFPDQGITLQGLNPSDAAWTMPPLHIGGAGIWSCDALQGAVRLVRDRQVANATPFGKWTINIPANVKVDGTVRPREAAGAGRYIMKGKTYKLAKEKEPVIDLVLSLKIAVRRRPAEGYSDAGADAAASAPVSATGRRKPRKSRSRGRGGYL